VILGGVEQRINDDLPAGVRPLSVARALLTQSLADVYKTRVSLGLPPQPEGDGDLGQVPADLDQTVPMYAGTKVETPQ
jgi:hypothetical protein